MFSSRVQVRRPIHLSALSQPRQIGSMHHYRLQAIRAVKWGKEPSSQWRWMYQLRRLGSRYDGNTVSSTMKKRNFLLLMFIFLLGPVFYIYRPSHSPCHPRGRTLRPPTLRKQLSLPLSTPQSAHPAQDSMSNMTPPSNWAKRSPPTANSSSFPAESSIC